MKTRIIVLIAVALLLTLVSCAPAAAPTVAPTATPLPLTVRIGQNDALGQFLTDNAGMTLYIYTKDTPNTSVCYDACAKNWPPLLIQGKPVGDKGINATLLNTTQRTDGTVQVTYNGLPLYYWAKDQKAGDTTGQNVGQIWYVISPAGEIIKK